MPQVKVNLKGIKSFGYIPPGVRRFRINDGELVKAKNTGNPMLKVLCECLDKEYVGTLFMDQFVLVEQSLWVLKKFMDAAQIPYTEEGFNTDSMIGKTLKIVCIDDEYEGKPRTKASDYIRDDQVSNAPPQVSGLTSANASEPEQKNTELDDANWTL